MLQILVVEDDPDKRSAIDGVLRETAPAGTTVSYAVTGFEARDAMAKTYFDLVVLDIALPKQNGAEVDSTAGVAILDEVVGRPNHYRVPTHIIGLTGFPDVLVQARGRFASYLLTLTFYDPSTTEWSDALKARIRHIVAARNAVAQDASEHHSELVVVCALQLELSAVLDLPWRWQQIAMSGDHTIYWKGAYQSHGLERTVHAAMAARMGMPAAASVASKMIHWFRPRFLAMTGIAAGIRNRTELGDIIAPDPCWDWGSGKWQMVEGEATFAAAPDQIRLDPWLRERLRLMSANLDWLQPYVSQWKGLAPPKQVRLRLGPLASGSAVLADGDTSERIVEQHRQLLGIEMETYGVYAAAEESSLPRPAAFALKSVVDFADGKKNDRFQPFGAYVSACALRHFAETHL